MVDLRLGMFYIASMSDKVKGWVGVVAFLLALVLVPHSISVPCLYFAGAYVCISVSIVVDERRYDKWTGWLFMVGIGLAYGGILSTGIMKP